MLLLEGPGSETLVDAWLSEHRAGPVLRVNGSSGALETLIAEGLAQLGPVRRARHPAARLTEDRAASDGNGVADFLVEAERRLRMREEVQRLLGELGTPNAAVVIVDRVEDADRALVDLLHALTEERSPMRAGDDAHDRPRVLVVATCAVAPTGRIAELAARPGASALSLRPLDRAGVRELLSSPDVVDAVLELTGGLPELIEKLVRGETLHAAAIASEGLPAPILRAREVLAVLERPIAHADLEAMVGAPIDAQLLVRGAADRGPDGWRASSALKARVRASLPAERTIAIYAQAAEVLAETQPDRAVRCALLAGAHERALALAPRAADVLVRRHALEDAAELLLAVVDGVEAAGELAPVGVALRLVELLWAAGDHAGAIARARGLLAQAPEDRAIALSCGQLLLHSGHPADAIGVLEPRAELDTDGAVDERTHEARALLAEALYRAGRTAEARGIADGVAEDAASIALRLDAENTLSKIDIAEGRSDDAEARLVRTLSQAELHGAGRQACQTLNNLGIVAMGKGELLAAERYLARCLELAEECGAMFHRGLAHKNLAVAKQLEGAWDDALHHSARALALLSGLVNPGLLARLAFNTADLHRSVGDPYRALRLCAHARDAAGELDRDLDAEGALVEGAVHLELGRPSDASEAYRHALAIAEEQGQSSRAEEARLGLARAALDAGERDEAARLLRESGEAVGARNAARRAWLEARLAPRVDAVPRARVAVDAAAQTSDPLLIQDARFALARALFEGGLASRSQDELRALRASEERLRGRVPEALRPLFDERALSRQVAQLEREIAAAVGGPTPRPSAPPPAPTTRDNAGGLIGQSPAMRELRAMIDRVGPTESTVLIHGESGSGKELVADAIHACSKREDEPLVRVNCAALVDTLLSSELFGHERGAFTGADRQKKGLFERADGGTILLDEIGDISPKMQASLLRVLQSRTFERVGGTQTITANVRVLCATHRDLAQLVTDGAFREDLYYRLSGITVRVPALRDRISDLGALARHLLQRIAAEEGTEPKSLAPDALQLLARHGWPGNVRELENVLRSAAVLSATDLLTAADFEAWGARPEPSVGRRSTPPSGASLGAMAYERVREGEGSIYELKKRLERECIERALDEADGNISRAADLLGMKRPRLSKLVNEWGLKQ
ncbi:MAG: sigma 54-interacting transcriptional regulator [Sandaracinaceae bacterium]